MAAHGSFLTPRQELVSEKEGRCMQGTHVYRLKWWVRLAASGFLAVSAIFGTAAWLRSANEARNPRFLPMLVSLICFAGGILWTFDAFGSRVTFSPERIEVRGLHGRKSLPLDAVRGRRAYSVSGGGDPVIRTRYFKLEPEDDRLPVLDFQRDYNFDSAFFEWFNKLPDLDSLDKKKNNFGLA